MAHLKSYEIIFVYICGTYVFQRIQAIGTFSSSAALKGTRACQEPDLDKSVEVGGGPVQQVESRTFHKTRWAPDGVQPSLTESNQV